jgi:uncharacterized membrane protein YkvA (DUF1232 family)
MSFKQTLGDIAAKLKQELAFYQRLYAHPETPRIAKVFFWLAIGYLLLPFDLIPDFIPILGQLDDVIIIPLLLYIALKITPLSVIENCRQQINNAV